MTEPKEGTIDANLHKLILFLRKNLNGYQLKVCDKKCCHDWPSSKDLLVADLKLC